MPTASGKPPSETRKLAAQAKAAAPDGEAYADHIARWDELAHAIDLTHAPVDILQRIATCIPPNSGLRLTNAEISATEVKLTGEAPQLQAVNTFSLNLSKNNGLTHFTWETPEPNQSHPWLEVQLHATESPQPNPNPDRQIFHHPAFSSQSKSRI